MADVSRLKFQGVIPGAPVGIIEQQTASSTPLVNKQCSEQLNKQPKTKETVLVTPL